MLPPIRVHGRFTINAAWRRHETSSYSTGSLRNRRPRRQSCRAARCGGEASSVCCLLSSNSLATDAMATLHPSGSMRSQPRGLGFRAGAAAINSSGSHVRSWLPGWPGGLCLPGTTFGASLALLGMAWPAPCVTKTRSVLIERGNCVTWRDDDRAAHLPLSTAGPAIQAGASA